MNHQTKITINHTTAKGKFYSLGDWGGAGSMKEYMEYYGYYSVPRIQDADIIVFNGGEDIATGIYGERPISNHRRYDPSPRDAREIQVFEEYADSGKLMLGICRGAQLINCLNGGTLWQDVSNHTRDHPLIDLSSGKTYMTTSVHHQMMRLTDQCEVIATSHESSFKQAQGIRITFNKSDGTPDQLYESDDPEIVWYPKCRGLLIQGHPEYVPGSSFGDYCEELIQKYMNMESR